MPIDLHWPAIGLRLALTIIAGGLLGAERSRTSHPAGLRTTLLVTLAASIAMIQMNLLLGTNGKPNDSYAVMDVMRLPLGILTGVGFIGAGAIVHKSELILGVTTAATLWFATVIGLCMGGGQLILGSVSTVVGLLVLWGLRYFEGYIERYQLAELRIVVEGNQLLTSELREKLKATDLRVQSLSVTNSTRERLRTFDYEVRWPFRKWKGDAFGMLTEIESLPGVVEVAWRPAGSGSYTAHAIRN